MLSVSLIIHAGKFSGKLQVIDQLLIFLKARSVDQRTKYKSKNMDLTRVMCKYDAKISLLLYYVMLHSHFTLYSVSFRFVLLFCVALRFLIFVVLRYVTLRIVMFHFVVLRYVTLCLVALFAPSGDTRF